MTALVTSDKSNDKLANPNEVYGRFDRFPFGDIDYVFLQLTLSGGDVLGQCAHTITFSVLCT